MRDLRKHLERLNETAEEQKRDVSRLEGQLEMLVTSLKNFGISASNAAKEVNKLERVISSQRSELKKLIESVENEFPEEFEK
jgi:septal ring factor EnvC (AmiA/AmiB activator)